MKIHLKQTEIVEALKQYITKQGISLVGKAVSIDFTAGRKDTGLSAEIDVDDSSIPGLVGDEDGQSKLALVVSPTIVAPAEPADTQPAPAADEVPAVETEAPVAKTATSLFN